MRRGRAAKQITVKHGSWSVEWKKAACSWLAHIKRDPEVPAGKALEYHNAVWLCEQRAAQIRNRSPLRIPLRAFAGWTDTRVARGTPSARFEEACGDCWMRYLRLRHIAPATVSGVVS